MQAIHDPIASAPSLAVRYHEQHKQRLAKIAERAFAPPAEMRAPEPIHIEIIEEEPSETGIEVIACNGQVVLVTKNQIIEARQIFEAATGVKVSIDRIQREICKDYGIRQIDLVSSRRTAKLVVPRQVAMFMSRRLTGKSFPEIGRRFGGRDHTTAIHAARKVGRLMVHDSELRERVVRLTRDLGGDIDAVLAEES